VPLDPEDAGRGLEALLDLDARFRIAAARIPEGLEILVAALTETGPPPA
jgi:hypothetical protein